MITLTQEVIPFYLTKLNVIAKENGGHLVLNRVSNADVAASFHLPNASSNTHTDNMGRHLLRWHH